jgi:PKD repeat protein
LSYEWDFGDGTDIDISENPTHEYESEDTYTVVLTVTNPWGVDSAESTMEVVTLPIANFSHTMGDLHPEDEIDFVNGSTGTGPLSYEWDFGDGTGTSTDKDLTYAYEEPGVYTVTLTTTSLYGSDSKERAVTILGIAPTASFESAEYAIVDAATVFTNTSTGAEPLSYEWDFGDDTVIDDSENPTHVFTVEDTYTVVLTVTNPWGVDSAEMTISAYTTPSASFFFNPNAYYPGDDVAFTNGSNGTGPLSYEWDFGDGVGTSTDEDPTYAYAESGVYTVKLTTTSPYGSDSFERLVMIDWQQLLPIIMR